MGVYVFGPPGTWDPHGSALRSLGGSLEHGDYSLPMSQQLCPLSGKPYMYTEEHGLSWWRMFWWRLRYRLTYRMLCRNRWECSLHACLWLPACIWCPSSGLPMHYKSPSMYCQWQTVREHLTGHKSALMCSTLSFPICCTVYIPKNLWVYRHSYILLLPHQQSWYIQAHANNYLSWFLTLGSKFSRAFVGLLRVRQVQ